MILPNYSDARKRTKSVVSREEYKIEDRMKTIGCGKTYFIKTYGCQMNEHDTENLKAMLEDMGFSEASDYKHSDLIILNTCSIRENAHNKAFGMLGRLKHLKEEREDIVVGLCGCMAQEEGVVKRILDKYKWINFVFGTHNIHRLPYILDEALKSKHLEVEVYSKEGNIVEGVPVKREYPYKAYVNIMYGCDKFCTYCIVPFTRGKQRSRNKDDIIKEVVDLKNNGCMEVTLLGQNVNAYGKDLDIDYGMEDLLRDVSLTGIPRVRFMTSHPWDFTDSMIEVIGKYDNIMPSVHLPVQSGSSRILKLMGRRYTKEEYLDLFNKIKASVPNVTISTDIIVGFPGETDDDFLDTLDLVNTCKYDNAYTFIFSKREGTAACRLKDDTPLEVKESRLYKLNDTVNKYFLENNQKLIGRVVPVLVEGKASGRKSGLFGYTDTNKLINFDGDDNLIGKIVNVEVVDAKTWSLDGKYID